MARLKRSRFRLEFTLPPGDLWVFGYGSLMWSPGFRIAEIRSAILYGYHRAFCILSYHYRGTKRRPGLVLGLDRGGACLGRALRVPATGRDRVVQYLLDREMISGVYQPRLQQVWLDGRKPKLALTFVANRQHPQYAGKLSLNHCAAMIAAAKGVNGDNQTYLENTVLHLDELGIPEGPLHLIQDRVRRLKRLQSA